MPNFDYVIWGGLMSESTDSEEIMISDGVHLKHWKGSTIIKS